MTTPDQILTLPSGSVWASEIHRHPSGAQVRCWHHVGGPKDARGIAAATRATEPRDVEDYMPRPNPLGVAIVLALAVVLIAAGVVVAFGDGHGWVAAVSIAAGLALIARVLDVGGRR